jgi:hypothetical protein
VWKKLAGFQKPLFGTSDNTLHPSPVSVFYAKFIKLKIASREPRPVFVIPAALKKDP